MTMSIKRSVMNELREVVEDSVEYVCDENMVSGEVAWTIIAALAAAKVSEMRGELDS